jgi:membrane fusion protein (multidrug efflux system)
MQVVAIQARQQPVVELVLLVGTLAANEAVEIKSETDGIVQEILFSEGQPVEKDELLLRLDETKLVATLAEAEASLRLSTLTFERARQLYEGKLISQQEYDQTSATFDRTRAFVDLMKRDLKDARVCAPFKGRTGARQVSPGQVITRNTLLTSLVDLDPMKVEMGIPERYLGQVQTGQRLEFEVVAYPGRRFEGEIYFIASQLDLATRTALVKTRIPNPDGRLKAGMVATLELRLRIRDSAILVPEVALISNGDQYFVFLVGPEQKAVLRPVKVGQRLPRWAEITEGVAAGDTVVVEGHQKIGPGAALQLAPPEKAAIYQTLELRSVSTNAATVR